MPTFWFKVQTHVSTESVYIVPGPQVSMSVKERKSGRFSVNNKILKFRFLFRRGLETIHGVFVEKKLFERKKYDDPMIIQNF